LDDWILTCSIEDLDRLALYVVNNEIDWIDALSGILRVRLQLW
jgi:hypothetical protein